MKNTQPNFEIIKTAFYQNFVGKLSTDMHILLEQIQSKMFMPSFNSRLKEFKADFNKWLDRVDIRQASVLIDILKEQKASVPGWMARKEYVIDYNKHEQLDLVRINIDSEENNCIHCQKSSCVAQECLDN